MKKLFEEYLFWIILVIGLLKIGSSFLWVRTYNLNQSIGWGNDITNFVWLGGYLPSIVFVIGYGIIYFTNRRTVYPLSIIHIVVILVNLFLWIPPAYSVLEKLLYYGSWVIFILNMVYSKRKGQNDS